MDQPPERSPDSDDLRTAPSGVPMDGAPDPPVPDPRPAMPGPDVGPIGRTDDRPAVRPPPPRLSDDAPIAAYPEPPHHGYIDAIRGARAGCVTDDEDERAKLLKVADELRKALREGIDIAEGDGSIAVPRRVVDFYASAHPMVSMLVDPFFQYLRADLGSAERDTEGDRRLMERPPAPEPEAIHPHLSPHSVYHVLAIASAFVMLGEVLLSLTASSDHLCELERLDLHVAELEDALHVAGKALIADRSCPDTVCALVESGVHRTRQLAGCVLAFREALSGKRSPSSLRGGWWWTCVGAMGSMGTFAGFGATLGMPFGPAGLAAGTAIGAAVGLAGAVASAAVWGDRAGCRGEGGPESAARSIEEKDPQSGAPAPGESPAPTAGDGDGGSDRSGDAVSEDITAFDDASPSPLTGAEEVRDARSGEGTGENAKGEEGGQENEEVGGSRVKHGDEKVAH